MNPLTSVTTVNTTKPTHVLIARYSSEEKFCYLTKDPIVKSVPYREFRDIRISWISLRCDLSRKSVE